MDEGQASNLNVTPTSHPEKFRGLLPMLAPTAHITQQNFLIASIPKIEVFHWLR